MITQSNMLFDLIQTTDESPQATNQTKTSQTAQVADLFDNLTLQSTAVSMPPTSTVATDGFADFADFSKFNNDSSAKKNQESFVLQSNDDDFADFTSFSSLPAQSTSDVTQLSRPVTATTPDDLLGLDLGSPTSNTLSNTSLAGQSSLPFSAQLQSSNLHSSLTGLAGTNLLFAAQNRNSSSNSSLSGSMPPIQVDNFLTPLTPSKPTSLNLVPADKLKNDKPVKQSPTASAILNKKNTWGGLTENLNIDLDNLLRNKKEMPKPSMNQLAATRITSNQPNFVQPVVVYSIRNTDACVVSEIVVCKTLCDLDFHPKFSGPDCFKKCCDENHLPCGTYGDSSNGTNARTINNDKHNHQKQTNNDQASHLNKEPANMHHERNAKNNLSPPHGNEKSANNSNPFHDNENKMNNPPRSNGSNQKKIRSEHPDHHNEDLDEKNSKKKMKNLDFFIEKLQA